MQPLYHAVFADTGSATATETVVRPIFGGVCFSLFGLHTLIVSDQLWVHPTIRLRAESIGPPDASHNSVHYVVFRLMFAWTMPSYQDAPDAYGASRE